MVTATDKSISIVAFIDLYLFLSTLMKLKNDRRMDSLEREAQDFIRSIRESTADTIKKKGRDLANKINSYYHNGIGSRRNNLYSIAYSEFKRDPLYQKDLIGEFRERQNRIISTEIDSIMRHINSASQMYAHYVADDTRNYNASDFIRAYSNSNKMCAMVVSLIRRLEHECVRRHVVDHTPRDWKPHVLFSKMGEYLERRPGAEHGTTNRNYDPLKYYNELMNYNDSMNYYNDPLNYNHGNLFDNSKMRSGYNTRTRKFKDCAEWIAEARQLLNMSVPESRELTYSNMRIHEKTMNSNKVEAKTLQKLHYNNSEFIGPLDNPDEFTDNPLALAERTRKLLQGSDPSSYIQFKDYKELRKTTAMLHKMVTRYMNLNITTKVIWNSDIVLTWWYPMNREQFVADFPFWNEHENTIKSKLQNMAELSDIPDFFTIDQLKYLLNSPNFQPIYAHNIIYLMQRIFRLEDDRTNDPNQQNEHEVYNILIGMESLYQLALIAPTQDSRWYMCDLCMLFFQNCKNMTVLRKENILKQLFDAIERSSLICERLFSSKMNRNGQKLHHPSVQKALDTFNRTHNLQNDTEDQKQQQTGTQQVDQKQQTGTQEQQTQQTGTQEQQTQQTGTQEQQTGTQEQQTQQTQQTGTQEQQTQQTGTQEQQTQQTGTQEQQTGTQEQQTGTQEQQTGTQEQQTGTQEQQTQEMQTSL
jgi:hypothetical protein